MGVNWKLELARLEFGFRAIESVPELACDSLSEGVDTPSMRILAGLGKGDREETREYLGRAVTELGIAYPTREESGWELMRFFIDAIASGKIDPVEGLHNIISHLYLNADWDKCNMRRAFEGAAFRELYRLYWQFDEAYEEAIPRYKGNTAKQLAELKRETIEAATAYRDGYLTRRFGRGIPEGLRLLPEEKRLRGIILGTAAGDSLGLPAEGLSRARIERLGWKGNWRQRFTARKGMMSDDTEQTIFVAQALLGSGDDVERFRRMLAWKLQLWLLGVPAGIGLGTLRAILKLWCGASPARSGVMSAGNGAAMRSAIIGGYCYDDPATMDEFVKASTAITHRDSRALVGAMAVAHSAAMAMRIGKEERPDIPALCTELRQLGSDEEWTKLVGHIEHGLLSQQSVGDFAAAIGAQRQVSGYVYQTVPVALYSWLAHWGDFRKTVEEVLDCGGDTDTTGAIAGALAGAVVGEDGIPNDWMAGFQDWPRGTRLMDEIADRLAAKRSGQNRGQVKYFWPAIPFRNAKFLLIVLWHAFARLVPDTWRRRMGERQSGGDKRKTKKRRWCDSSHPTC